MLTRTVSLVRYGIDRCRIALLCFFGELVCVSSNASMGLNAARICAGMLSILFVLFALLAAAQADARCSDPVSAEAIFRDGWTGCQGVYPARDSSQLSAAATNGYQNTHKWVYYTFGNTGQNVVAGQVMTIAGLFQGHIAFRENIGWRDMSSLTAMGSNVQDLGAINQNISGELLHSVITIAKMFYRAASTVKATAGRVHLALFKCQNEKRYQDD